jgi:hypothetical protein
MMKKSLLRRAQRVLPRALPFYVCCVLSSICKLPTVFLCDMLQG